MEQFIQVEFTTVLNNINKSVQHNNLYSPLRLKKKKYRTVVKNEWTNVTRDGLEEVATVL